MKFLILTLFISSAYCQLPSIGGGGGNFEADVKENQEQAKHLRKLVDDTMRSCVHTAQGKNEAQNITENAKKASEYCNKMWKECPLKKYETDPKKTGCIASYQKSETTLCGELKPFGDLTGPMPKTLWQKICGPDAKDYKEDKKWTSKNSAMPTTKTAYKCLEEMDDYLDKMEKGEQCKPSV